MDIPNWLVDVSIIGAGIGGLVGAAYYAIQISKELLGWLRGARSKPSVAQDQLPLDWIATEDWQLIRTRLREIPMHLVFTHVVFCCFALFGGALLIYDMITTNDTGVHFPRWVESIIIGLWNGFLASFTSSYLLSRIREVGKIRSSAYEVIRTIVQLVGLVGFGLYSGLIYQFLPELAKMGIGG